MCSFVFYVLFVFFVAPAAALQQRSSEAELMILDESQENIGKSGYF